jgi:hypothetical protein
MSRANSGSKKPFSQTMKNTMNGGKKSADVPPKKPTKKT